MNGHVEERLSDFLDGSLEPSVRVRVREHLERCAACRSALDELKEVVRRAENLEDRPPERDLWPAIASRIAASRTVPALRRETEAPGPAPGGEPGEGASRSDDGPDLPWERTLAVPVRTLAPAAALLLAVSLGGGWLLGRASGAPEAGTAAAGRASPGPGGLPSETPVAWVGTVQRGYAESIAELEAELAAHRDRLSPATREALARSLASIDSAIAEARRALARDTADPELPRYLSETYRRKVDVLKVALELSAGD